MAKSSDERIKGFLWGIDPASEPALKEQDAKARQAELDRQKNLSTTSGQVPAATTTTSKTPSKSAFTTEPLKLFKAKVTTNGSAIASSETSGHPPVTLQLSPMPKSEPQSAVAVQASVKTEAPKSTIQPQAQSLARSPSSTLVLSTASKPIEPQGQPNVVLPIIVAPLPESYDSSSAAAALASSPAAAILSSPPMVVHEGTLILNPTVFSHLTPERLKELEQMGTQKALETLQGDVARFLKAKMRPEGAGRGRGRGKAKARGGGRGRGGLPIGKVIEGTGDSTSSTTTTTAVAVDGVEATANGVVKREDEDVTTEEPPAKRVKLDTEEVDGDIDILGT